MKTILYFLLCSLIVCACAEDEDQRLTYEHFERNLRKDIPYHQMVVYFGNPLEDIGSGIHIYVYNLRDGTKMLIGYTDKVVYARHYTEDGQLLHELI